jgi:hypothetical protein
VVQFYILDVVKVSALLIVIVCVRGLLRALIAPEQVHAFVRGRPD